MRPDKAHTEKRTYFICSSNKRFYSSRCIAKIALVLKWPYVLGKKILIETEIKGLYKSIDRKLLILGCS